MFRLQIYILASILLLSLAFRLYRFNAPMADLHSWRQADTAAVARNFTYNGFDVLHPQILSAVSIDGMGRDNNFRYHFAEFPTYQIFTALGSYLTGDIVSSGRVVSIVSGLISVFVLYLLAKRYFDERIALTAAFVYGMLPYGVFWSRTVLPDQMMLMFCLLTLFFFDKWVRDPEQGSFRFTLLGFQIDRNYLLALFFFANAFLMKAFPLFLLIPMTYLLLKKFSMSWIPSALLSVIPVIAWNVYLEVVNVRPQRWWLLPVVLGLVLTEAYLIYKYRNYIWKLRALVLLVAVSAIPFLFWRVWMRQWPMSIPASSWLFDGKNLRLKPAWWHWIFQDRLDRLMFNFSGLLLIGVGLLNHSEMFRPLTYGVQKVRESGNIFSSILRFFGFKFKYDPEEKTTDVNLFFPISLATCLLYFVVFATGNVTHEYYQIVIIPFGAVLLSVGFWYIWDTVRSFWDGVLRRISVIGLLGVTLLLGWYSVRDWYSIGNPMQITIGARADQLLPADAQVIAPYGGDTTFLYYINRPGWSVQDKSLGEMIDRGATHYISNYRDEGTNRLARLYSVVEETPEYVIIDLRERQDNPEWETVSVYKL